MNKTTQYRIEEIKKNGYTLNFETVFNQAFENYKKIALYGGLIIFVFFVLLSILAFGVLMAIFGGAAVLEFLNPENLKSEDLSLNFLLIVSGISVVITALMSPLTAGLIKMAYCAERDEEFHVATMFQYYKAPYFKELFLATFFISFLTSVLSSVINYAQIPFINAIVSIAVTLFSLFTIPLIIFGNLKAIEGIQTSFIIVSKQPAILLGLLVVGIVATMVGLIGCCIGIVFTIPFMYSLYYAMYNEIVGFESEDKYEANI